MALRASLTTHMATPLHADQRALPFVRDRISPQFLQRTLGALWLLDGLFQLQPPMFTTTLITGFMQPLTQGQPGPIAAGLQPVITFTAQHLVPANAAIALVQLVLGICLLAGWFVRSSLLASVVWSLAVWYWGEGLGMFLTGHATALTGAPGAVLLYGILGLAAYPTAAAGRAGLLPRRYLQWILAGFWAMAAVLQLQAPWWQPQQIAQTITGVEAPGTLNGTILDSSLTWLAGLAGGVEVPLNSAIIVVALELAAGLAIVPRERIRPLLALSIVLSLLLWWVTEGCGLVLTGGTTDVNSGPLVVLLALACWPVERGGVTYAPKRTAPKQSRSPVRVDGAVGRTMLQDRRTLGRRELLGACVAGVLIVVMPAALARSSAQETSSRLAGVAGSPASALLTGYPQLYQQHVLCCEAVASMATGGRLSEQQILDQMPHNASPGKGFRSNVDGAQSLADAQADYGIYAPPLARELQRFGYQTQVMTGSAAPALLLRRIGVLHRPVEVWVIHDLVDYPAITGYAAGRSFTRINGEHARLAIGYHAYGIHTLDPIDGRAMTPGPLSWHPGRGLPTWASSWAWLDRP